MKWPRVYAREIVLETSREKRISMLDQVPAHLQALVRKHTEIAYELRKSVGNKRQATRAKGNR